MITPQKHLDLNLSPIKLSAMCIEYIRLNGGIGLADLANYIRTEAGADAEPNFAPTLNILYLLGVIEYIPKIDAIILSNSAVLI